MKITQSHTYVILHVRKTLRVTIKKEEIGRVIGLV